MNKWIILAIVAVVIVAIVLLWNYSAKFYVGGYAGITPPTTKFYSNASHPGMLCSCQWDAQNHCPSSCYIAATIYNPTGGSVFATSVSKERLPVG